jgi:hypothetical protein
LVFWVLLLGCTPRPADTGSAAGPDVPDPNVLDLRADFPPPPATGVLYVMDNLEIAPGEHGQFCTYHTWDGPDVGVVSYIPLHAPWYHHHSLIRATTDAAEFEAIEDGVVVECPYGEEGVGGDEQGAILYNGVFADAPAGDGDWLNLPEGVAIKLRNGQRFAVDTHYVNTSDKILKINTGFILDMIAEEEVVAWANNFDHDVGTFSLPPGEETTMRFTCPVERDAQILSLIPHMHEHGTEYRIEIVGADGTVTELLHIPEWSGDYRFNPPNFNTGLGGLTLGEGDLLRTTCTWFNPFETPLAFPDEMCTTSGMAIGLEAPTFCDGSPTVEVNP